MRLSGAEGWVETRKIVIGRNDLVEDTFWGEAIIAPGKLQSI